MHSLHLLSCALGVATAAAVTSTGNLFKNPGFENSAKKYSPWYLTGSAPYSDYSGLCSRNTNVTVAPYDGDECFMLEQFLSHGLLGLYITQNVTLVQNQKYNMTFWARTQCSAGDTWNSCGCNPYIEMFAGPLKNVANGKVPFNGHWHQYHTTYTWTGSTGVVPVSYGFDMSPCGGSTDTAVIGFDDMSIIPL